MSEIYSKIISSGEFTQVRLSISEFRGTEYLSLREYYLDFDEEWRPTDRGITLPLDLDITMELFRGMSEILSLKENKQVLDEYFSEIIQEIYQK